MFISVVFTVFSSSFISSASSVFFFALRRVRGRPTSYRVIIITSFFRFFVVSIAHTAAQSSHTQTHTNTKNADYETTRRRRQRHTKYRMCIYTCTDCTAGSRVSLYYYYYFVWCALLSVNFDWSPIECIYIFLVSPSSTSNPNTLSQLTHISSAVSRFLHSRSLLKSPLFALYFYLLFFFCFFQRIRKIDKNYDHCCEWPHQVQLKMRTRIQHKHTRARTHIPPVSVSS